MSENSKRGKRLLIIGLLTIVGAAGFLLLDSRSLTLVVPVFVVASVALSAERFHSKPPTSSTRTGRARERDNIAAHNILVIGSEARAIRYLGLRRRALRSFRTVGFLPLDSTPRQLEQVLDNKPVDEVMLVAFHTRDTFDQLATSCAVRGITFRALLAPPTPVVGRFSAEALDGAGFLLSLETVPKAFLPLLIKRAMDIIGAAAGLCVCGLAYVWYGFRIRRQSEGSIIFKQRRVGRNGRSFIVYKFRTMSVDAEQRLVTLKQHNQMRGFMFKMPDDPRVTRIGRKLRAWHIDELPQFWNVLRGDMSLVGPRPPTPEEVGCYRNYHRRRLSMKPGITGLWQVRGNEAVNDFEDVVRLDCNYIDNWSLWLDVKILLRTFRKILQGSGW